MMTMFTLLMMVLMMPLTPSVLYTISCMGLLVFSLMLINPFMLGSPSFLLMKWGEVDSSSWLLATLSLLMVTLMLAVLKPLGKVFNYTHVALAQILTVSFICKKMIMFYMFFELSLMPISLLIMGWGYQPERVGAFVYMLLYTISGSLPLLITLYLMHHKMSLSMFSELGVWQSLMHQKNALQSILTISLTLGFLVKFPMYGLHLWLPKAHVEAPVGGSMILAGLLLKLGGFGMIQLSPWVPSSTFTMGVSSMALSGGLIVSLMCTRQTDMKILIAYSSVSHLSMAIMAILMKTMTLKMSALVILVAHGISSPGMFYGAHLMYTRSNSRNTLINMSMLNTLPVFTMWWFMLAMANMGAPPMLNLWGELVSLTMAMSMNKLFIAQLGMLVFLGGAYTLILFAASQQGQKKINTKLLKTFSFQENLNMLMMTAPLVILSLTLKMF